VQNNDEIRKLTFPEAIRKRPGMYVGGANPNGLHHCACLILDNSVDEFLSGRCKNISVELHKDGSLLIQDDGAGIPTEVHPTFGVSTLEVVMRCDALPINSPGIVNALSEWFRVLVHHKGEVWELPYARGIKQSNAIRIGATDAHGTAIHFKPDPEIFRENTLSETLLNERLCELAFLNPGLTMEFKNLRNARFTKYLYLEGVRQHLRESNTRAEVSHEMFAYKGEQDGILVDLAFQYTPNQMDQFRSFVNLTRSDSGTHEDGFIKSMQKFFGGGLAGEAAIRSGLTAVLSVKLPNPEWYGPRRLHLNNVEAETAVRSVLNREFSKLIASGSPCVDAIQRKIRNNVSQL
jgi:DNA gyrase subunit B